MFFDLKDLPSLWDRNLYHLHLRHPVPAPLLVVPVVDCVGPAYHPNYHSPIRLAQVALPLRPVLVLQLGVDPIRVCRQPVGPADRLALLLPRRRTLLQNLF